MQCFNKIMNCQLFDTIWNGLAPLDPLFDKLEVLAPPGIEFDILGRMFILSVLGFLVIRAFAENVPLPLPKYKTWNKLTFSHFIWMQIWYVWIICTSINLWNASNNSTYTGSWSARYHRALPGGSVFCHAHIALNLSNLFIIWWLNIRNYVGANCGNFFVFRLLMWTACAYPYGQYWGIRAGGFTFISSWFLSNAQAFNFFPALKQKYPKLNAWNRLAFAVTFLTIRVLLWLCWLAGTSRDALQEIQTNGISWPLVVASSGWILLTIGHLKSGKAVWNGLVAYARGKAKVAVVMQLRTKVA